MTYGDFRTRSMVFFFCFRLLTASIDSCSRDWRMTGRKMKCRPLIRMKKMKQCIEIEHLNKLLCNSENIPFPEKVQATAYIVKSPQRIRMLESFPL